MKRYLGMLKKLLNVAIATSIVISGQTVAVADQYNVNAVVPYPIPTQRAVFTNQNDVNVLVAQQTLTGSCQEIAPSAVVSIWSKGVLMGSTVCNSGLFSVPIMLAEGTNILVARTMNGNGVYGPDSHPLLLKLELPPKNVIPLPGGVNEPTTPAQQITATNAGGASALTVTTPQPFSLLDSTNNVSLKVTLKGGQQPYVLNIKWGDGATESHTLDEPGDYNFVHAYQSTKAYQVYVKVRDVLGAYTEYAYAVISGKTATNTSGGGSTSDAATQKGPWKLAGLVWYCWLAIIVAVIFLLMSYIMGYVKGRERTQAERERLRSSKKRRRRLKK